MTIATLLAKRNSTALWDAFARQLLARTHPSYDPATELASFAGVASSADIAGSDAAVANFNIQLYGNSVPVQSTAYVPSGDLASMYAVLLDEAGSAGIDPLELTRGRASVRAALEVAGPTSFNMPVRVSPDALTGFAPAYVLEGFGRTYAQWLRDDIAGRRIEPIHVSTAAESAERGKRVPALIAASDFPPFFDLGGEAETAVETAFEGETAPDSGTLTVGFTGLAAVPIAPTSWFSPELLTRLRDRPAKAGHLSAASRLSLVPAHLVVGLGVSIDLELDQAFAEMLRASAATASIRIGPFMISAPELTAAAPERVRDDRRSLTIRIGPVAGSVPLLLAIISRRF